jgi:hypothetical protein
MTIEIDVPGSNAAHSAVVGLLELLHGPADGLDLIEIDCDGSSIGDYLPAAAVTRLDPKATAATLRERGEAGAPGSLAFPAAFFDYAVVVDALDRFEPGSRLPLMAELRRVTRRGVIVVGPFDSEWIRGVDRIIDEANPDAVEGGGAVRELPSLDDVKEFFDAHGDETTVYGDDSLSVWAATRCHDVPGVESDPGLREVDRGAVFRRTSNGDGASYRSLLVSLREAAGLNGEVLGVGDPAPPAAGDGAAAATLATVALSNELRQLHRRLELEEQRLVTARATLSRRDAQIEDLSHRLADTLTALSAERGERELSHREIATMQKAHAWRVMARFYYATRRVRNAIKAPPRFVRDVARRFRRRVRAL